MIYTRPSMHKDAKTRGSQGFHVHQRCPVPGQALIRMNQARTRSTASCRCGRLTPCSATKGDWAWHRHVLNMIAADVKAKPGKIIWNAGSFHVYPRHEHLVEEFVDREQAEIRNRRQGVWTLRAE